MTPGWGIELRTHWWEMSSLTTVPTLLPDFQCSQLAFLPFAGNGSIYMYVVNILVTTLTITMDTCVLCSSLS